MNMNQADLNSDLVGFSNGIIVLMNYFYMKGLCSYFGYYVSLITGI
jgi:hypothetical protein